MTLEELEKAWKVPEHLKEKVVELLKKGYRLDEMAYVGNDLEEEFVNLLISGKGFSKEELFAKIADYTAKDMPASDDDDEDDDDYDEDDDYEDDYEDED